MNIGRHHFRAFVRYLAMYFVGLMLFAVLPNIANYYWKFVEPFPTRQGLLDLVWIFPLLVVLCALGTLFLTKGR